MFLLAGNYLVLSALLTICSAQNAPSIWAAVKRFFNNGVAQLFGRSVCVALVITYWLNGTVQNELPFAFATPWGRRWNGKLHQAFAQQPDFWLCMCIIMCRLTITGTGVRRTYIEHDDHGCVFVKGGSSSQPTNWTPEWQFAWQFRSLLLVWPIGKLLTPHLHKYASSKFKVFGAVLQGSRKRSRSRLEITVCPAPWLTL